MTEAFAFQNEGSDFLASRVAAMLADDPGLGKTFQAIRAADRRIVLRVGVICPASVVATWHAEIAAHREGDWTHFVTSYEGAVGRDYKVFAENEWDVLILDEAHFLKTVTARRTKTIYGFTAEDGMNRLPAIIDRAGAVWLLTGTPMPNNPSELFSHLRALHPEAIRSTRTGQLWSLFQFIAAYCRTEDLGYGPKIVGAKQEAKLRGKLQGFMLRRRKSEVLKDLPPLRFGEIAVEGDLSALPADEIEIVRKALNKGGFDALKDVAGHVAKLRRLTGLAKLPSTIAWLKDWLEGAEGQKIVVFAHHTDVIRAIASAIGKAAVTLDGSSSMAQRKTAVERFQNDPKVRVFVGQITAAGTGITLTAASDMLFVETSWVPADMQQASQRIHRIGQTESCLVRFAIVPNSIDADIQRAVARKLKMIDAVIEGVG